MESSWPRSYRTGSRCSSAPSPRRAFVETRNKRSKSFAVVELLAELARGVFAGDPADAHAIQHAIGRIILLNKDGRVGGAEPVAEPFGVAAIAESSDLQGEKTSDGVNSPQNSTAHSLDHHITL